MVGEDMNFMASLCQGFRQAENSNRRTTSERKWACGNHRDA
jgi:hypothetical protein